MTTPNDPWARREAWRNQFGFRNNARLSWPGLSWGIGAFIIYLGYETLTNRIQHNNHDNNNNNNKHNNNKDIITISADSDIDDDSAAGLNDDDKLTTNTFFVFLNVAMLLIGHFPWLFLF
ncbi:13678_t:CDS:2 [Entrophospora sp. SA101]|nr:13678_t:CDS:2 [Entrophospora sp. SA101]CAJ0829024.1 21255_t:CDS:2 [Entrophospora sp. SA101]